MGRDRDDPLAWPENGASDRRSDAAAPDRLYDAVCELRAVAASQLLQRLERLAEDGSLRGPPGVSVENVRKLRLRSAEHLCLAAELEAAARCCRIIEQELREQIDGLLTGSPGQAPAPGNHGLGAPPRKSHRAFLTGWRKVISQRTHPSQDPPDEGIAAASTPAPERFLMSPPQGSVLSNTDEADVAAMLLGPLELWVAGRRVERWNSLKARDVFQYLLIHRDRPVRRDVLMELEWPNHTYASARNNLNVALHSLRNTLEGPWEGRQPIVYQDGCYSLNPELSWWVDRDEFLFVLSRAHLLRVSNETQQAIHLYQLAVQLYRGPLFEDDGSGDWYLPEQSHLNDLYLEALESLGEIYLELGEVASAERFGREALKSDPCCEPVHRLLMRCYASSHKQQLVSRQYHHCVNALRDELGISPGPETLRLFHDLTAPSA